MKKLVLVFLSSVPIFLLSGPSIAQGWRLIAPEEVKAYADRTNLDSIGVRSIPPPSAQKIIVQLPNLARIVQSPTDIPLIFIAASGATTKPDAFRVTYGTFGFDVTDRILSRNRLDETGLTVKGAGLPSVKHLFTMTIENSIGRKKKRAF